MHTRHTRLKYLGIIAVPTGLTVMARIEALHGAAGWQAIGRVLSLDISHTELMSGEMEKALARAKTLESERLRLEYEAGQPELF